MATKNKKNREETTESGGFSKETLFVALVAFSLLVFVMLCARSVFGAIGDAVDAFMFGVLGYMAYPVMLFIAASSVTALVGKKLPVKVSSKIFLFLTVFFLATTVHLGMSLAAFGDSMGDYISYCFHAAETVEGVVGNATFFGVLGGAVAYPFRTLLSSNGAMVVLSLFTVVFGYLSVLSFMRKRERKEKKVKVQKQEKVLPPVEEEKEYIVEKRGVDPLVAERAKRVVQEAKNKAAVSAEAYSAPAPVSYEAPASSYREEYEQPALKPAVSIIDKKERYPETREEKDIGKNILLRNSSADFYRDNLIYDDNSKFNARLKNAPRPVSAMEKATPSRPAIEESSYLEDYQKSKDVSSELSRPAPYTAVEPASREEDYFNDSLEEDELLSEPERAATFEEEKREIAFDEDFRRLDRYRVEEETDPFAEAEASTRSRGYEDVTPEEDEVRGFGERSTRSRGYEDVTPEEDEVRGYGERSTRSRGYEESFDEETKDNFFDEESQDYADDYEDEDELAVKPVYEEEIRTSQSSAKGLGMFGKTDFSVHKGYVRPPISLFRQYKEIAENDKSEQEEQRRIILETLRALVKIQAEVVSVTAGPTFTRYDVKIPPHIPSKRIVACSMDIAMNLRSKDGVNIFPNYENGTNSIEVPNKNRGMVGLAPLLEGAEYKNAPADSLIFAIGKDVEGRNIYGKIAKMTHLLVAGATGAGKSCFLNALILSLIIRYTPEELRLILVDPKQVEFSVYNHMPHLMVNEIISEPIKVIAILNWAIEEMERRYMLFNQMSVSGTLVRNIDEYNEHAKVQDKLPKIVMIVDELADLMLQNKSDIEDKISRLTAKSRACGIHLVLATQRPSVNVITGVIKANLPTRFAFKVSAEVDSRTILDDQGAEKLLGNGDLLYKTSAMYTPMRVQGAYVSSEEVQQVVEFIKTNNEAYYDSSVEEIINRKMNENMSAEGGEEGGTVEPLFIDALRMVVQQGAASISMIQRKFSVGYNKAGRIIEWMQEMGYVSAFDGAKTRKVLLTQEEFDKIYGENNG